MRGYCSYCKAELVPAPRRKKKCPECGQTMYVRDGKLLQELDAFREDWLVFLAQFNVKRRDFDQAGKDLSLSMSGGRQMRTTATEAYMYLIGAISVEVLSQNKNETDVIFIVKVVFSDTGVASSNKEESSELTPSLTPAVSDLPKRYCDSGPISRLQTGMMAYVSTDPPYANKVREKPGINQTKVGQIEPGSSMLIISGPECKNGLTWWYVKESDANLSGWTAEGDKDDYWLVPCDISICP